MKLFKNLFGQNSRQPEPALEPELTSAGAVGESLLSGGIAGVLPFPSERRKDAIYIPALEMTICPRVRQLQQHAVNLDFVMYTRRWDKHFYESCTGSGKDTRAAVGEALASFGFSFMSGLKRMYDKYEPRRITSTFADKTHVWDVYLSDLIAIGSKREADASEKMSAFWELLREDIQKRLGNQTLVYVKIFAAKLDGNVIGECRIDDIPVPELGEKIAAVAEGWELAASTGFATEKQFFLIEQHEDTTLDYPYRGEDGREALRQKLIAWLELLGKLESPADADSLVDAGTAATGDRTLAIACRRFLPEICAAHALSEHIRVRDLAVLQPAEGEAVAVSTFQLSDYQALDEALGSVLTSKALGEKTEDIYYRLLTLSAIHDVFEQARSQQPDVRTLTISGLTFPMEPGFALR